MLESLALPPAVASVAVATKVVRADWRKCMVACGLRLYNGPCK